MSHNPRCTCAGTVLGYPQHELHCHINGGPRPDNRRYPRPVVETHIDGHHRLLAYRDASKVTLLISRADDDRPTASSRWDDLAAIAIPTERLQEILTSIGVHHA
ncbi:hypothetical protein ABH922_003039 [Rhodococcus sp. 27YEA15]|uniref:hypothetical protein n=1 Tax=Rhodococcus sp. 27YEA15 TaxID=3156259 RepID=UPI003C7C32A0